MAKKKYKKESRLRSIGRIILEKLDELLEIIPEPIETPYNYIRRLKGHYSEYPYWRYRETIKRLAQRGWIEKIKQEGREFIKLTKKGKVALLLQKIKVQKELTWDGKWRLIIFDIPEVANRTRDIIRRRLKGLGFLKLQASVYISPYSLSQEIIEYLKLTRLIKYIRFLRVDKIDDDRELRKRFRI